MMPPPAFAAAARIASGLLLALSAFIFLVSLALIFLVGPLVRGSSDTLTQLISDAMPGAKVHSEAVAVEFSLSGIHLRADALTLTYDNSHLAASQANIWLQQDGVLQIALHEARLTLAPGSGALPLLAFRFSAPQAHIVLPAANLTLHQTDVFARGDAEGWSANLRQGQQLHARVSGDAAQHVRLLAVANDYAPPAPLAQHLNWSGLHATLAIAIGADGVRYRTHGTFAELADRRSNTTVQAVHWRGHGTCTDLATCGSRHSGQLSLSAALPAMTLSLHLANAGWRKESSHWQVLIPALHLHSPTQGWQTSVQLNVNAEAQRFAVQSALLLPYLPTERAHTVTLSADAQWQQAADNWQLRVPTLLLSDDDLTLSAQARLYRDDADIAYRIRGSAEVVPLTAVAHYLPDDALQQWFDTAMYSGNARNLAFDFAQGNQAGTAVSIRQVRTMLEDGALHIDTDWAPAQHLHGTLVLHNDAVNIHGRGVFDGITVDAVHAQIPAAFSAQPTLLLSIRSAQSAFATLLAAARRSPATRDFMTQAEQDLSLPPQGRGQLLLHIAVPLAAPETTQAHATLAVRGAGVQAGTLPAFRNIVGTLHFSNTTYGGTLSGHLTGLDADAPRLTAAFDSDALTLYGVADVSLLLSVANIHAAPLSGSTSFTVSRTAQATLFVAILDGTVIDLPAPLGKGGFETAHLSVHFGDGASEVHYLARMITLHMRQQGNGTNIGINSRAGAPPQSGINLHGSAASVDLDLWLAQGGDSQGGHFASLQLTLHDANFTGINNPHFIISGGSGGSAAPLSLHLDTTHSRGDVVFAEQHMHGQFSYLSIPLDGNTRGGSESNYLASLTLAIAANTLVVGGLTLGALTLAGAPGAAGAWHISTMRVDNPHLTMDIGGVYENTHTYLTLHLNVGSLPALMTILQIPQVFGEGRVSLFGSIGWPGAPTDFSLGKMIGNVRLLGEQVRYLDVDLGTNVVNFLAIFSPQSLFSLGFTELGKGGGITFNRVQGDISINSGEAQFTPINLTSRNLRMDIQGSTDFIYRRYDIHGRVRPGEKLLAAGSVVGLGTGLTALNPATFVAGSLLGKIFEKPLSEIGAYDYTITGTWEEPVYQEGGFIGDSTPSAPQNNGAAVQN